MGSIFLDHFTKIPLMYNTIKNFTYALLSFSKLFLYVSFIITIIRYVYHTLCLSYANTYVNFKLRPRKAGTTKIVRALDKGCLVMSCNTQQPHVSFGFESGKECRIISESELIQRKGGYASLNNDET